MLPEMARAEIVRVPRRSMVNMPARKVEIRFFMGIPPLKYHTGIVAYLKN